MKDDACLMAMIETDAHSLGDLLYLLVCCSLDYPSRVVGKTFAHISLSGHSTYV